MRSTILRAVTALLLGAGAAAAADSTGFAFPDVPWQKPWARTADGLQGMPTSYPDGQVLTVGSGGAFSCVEASSSTTVNQCSAAVTLVGGKTYQACCNAAGTVTSIGGGSSICKFSGASCPGGWSSYQNWTATVSNTCGAPNPCDLGSCSITTGSHAFSNVSPENPSACYGNSLYSAAICYYGNYSCQATVSERGCI